MGLGDVRLGRWGETLGLGGEKRRDEMARIWVWEVQIGRSRRGTVAAGVGFFFFLETFLKCFVKKKSGVVRFMISWCIFSI